MLRIGWISKESKLIRIKAPLDKRLRFFFLAMPGDSTGNENNRTTKEKADSSLAHRHSYNFNDPLIKTPIQNQLSSSLRGPIRSIADTRLPRNESPAGYALRDRSQQRIVPPLSVKRFYCNAQKVPGGNATTYDDDDGRGTCERMRSKTYRETHRCDCLSVDIHQYTVDARELSKFAIHASTERRTINVSLYRISGQRDQSGEWKIYRFRRWLTFLERGNLFVNLAISRANERQRLLYRRKRVV